MAQILLPTDFSGNSLNACAYAIDLFGGKGNTFHLLHAYLDPIPANTVWPGVSGDIHKASMEGMAEFLKRFRSLKNADTVETRTEVRYGPVAPVAQDLAVELGVDIIVMGTQGSTGVTFLGSTASELAKHSGVPVLIVPKDACYKGLRRILLADDHKSVEPKVLAPLVRMAGDHGAEIVIAHVVRGDEEEPEPRIIAQYDEVLANVEHSFIGVHGDDVPLALSNVAERDNMDMVVVLHRHMGLLDTLFHRSAAKRLAMHGHVPLLVLEN